MNNSLPTIRTIEEKLPDQAKTILALAKVVQECVTPDHFDVVFKAMVQVIFPKSQP